MDKFYLGVANNNIAKSMGFNQTGWHRIAKYSFIDDTDSVFRGSNGCDIIINCMDINAFYLSETYALRLLVGGDSSILSLSGCMGRDEGDSLNSKRYLTKVRHTLNTDTKEAYIEVYIPELGTNNYYVLINNGADQFHYWEPIDPISVEETVEGFNTYSEIELPLESFGTASHDNKGKVFEEYYYHKDNKPSKSDVGLGNVPNVATNDQTPTYSEASSLAKLTSGEKLSVAFGKIAKGITDLISHLSSTSNPHSVTKTQVGLGNVDNTSDANKPVSTAQATAIADAKKVVQDDLLVHIKANSNPHNVTISQIGAAPSGFGLGETNAKVAMQCGDAVLPGFYSVDGSSTDYPSEYTNFKYGSLIVNRRYSTVFQTITQGGVTAHRYGTTADGGVTWTWNDWEYENPPLSLGISYKTTKRYKGKPVYAIIQDVGALPDKSKKEVYVGSGSGIKPSEYLDIRFLISGGGREHIGNTLYNNDGELLFRGCINGTKTIEMITFKNISDYTARVYTEYVL